MNVCGRDIRIEGRLIRIARLEADKYHFIEDPEPLLDGLRKCGARIDLFTFMQRLPETAPKYSYPMEWDNLAVLPISTYDDWFTKQVDNKIRNMVRKTEKKGVVIREVPFDDALVRGIWEVYNECPVRQGTPFRHYGKDIETVHKMSATFLDSSIFIGAYLDDKLIGFVKLVVDETRTQANVMHVVSMVSHKDKAPTNALVAQAVRSCADRKIPNLAYANFAYGKKETSSLSDFKERNGFQRVDVPRYYVALTPVGSLAFQLGLHRRLVDLVPESIAARLRDFRKAWYKHRLQSAAESF
jgi:hypothetical protein